MCQAMGKIPTSSNTTAVPVKSLNLVMEIKGKLGLSFNRSLLRLTY